MQEEEAVEALWLVELVELEAEEQVL